MTPFDITLAIGIIWLISLFIAIKIGNRPTNADDWLDCIMGSLVITLFIITILIILGGFICLLIQINWYSFFNYKVF